MIRPYKTTDTEKDVSNNADPLVQESKERWNSRTELLIGREGVELLADRHVAVFGLGGVGSYAAEALARAGVGRMTLVDFDRVTVSNINRQIEATWDNVGRLKTETMAERIYQINPEILLQLRTEFVTPDNTWSFSNAGYDYIADAIDHVPGKIALLRQSAEEGIPAVSCMGTGNKLDPSALRVADISHTSVCPLARIVRRELRKAGIISGIKAIYSEEQPVSIRSGEAETDVNDQKGRIIGSISFVPSVAGLLMAGTIINDLLNS